MASVAQSLGSRIGWVALGRTGNTILLIAINIILARVLSERDFGLYQQYRLIVKIALPIFLFGFPISLNYFLPARPTAERHAFARQTILITMTTGLMFCAGLFAYATFFVENSAASSTSFLLQLTALLGLAMIATGFWEPFLINYDRHRWLAISMLLLGALQLAAVVIGWWWDRSLVGIFVALAIFGGLRIGIVAIVTVWLLRPLQFDMTRERLGQQFRYVLPIGLSDGIDTLSRWADKIIVTTFFTASQFAYYFNGAFELPLVDVVVQSIRSVVLPDYAAAYHRGDRDEVVRLLHLTARQIAFFIFPLTVFSFIIAPDMMALLFGETYRISGSYFRIFVLLLPIRISTTTSVLLAAGQSKRVLQGTVLDVFLAVTLAMALIPEFGLFGPAVATVVATYCQVLFYLIIVGRLLNLSMGEWMPWRYLLKLAALALGSGAGLAVLGGISAIWLKVLLGLIIYGVLYLSIGYFGRIFEAVELSILQRIFNRKR